MTSIKRVTRYLVFLCAVRDGPLTGSRPQERGETLAIPHHTWGRKMRTQVMQRGRNRGPSGLKPLCEKQAAGSVFLTRVSVVSFSKEKEIGFYELAFHIFILCFFTLGGKCSH